MNTKKLNSAILPTAAIIVILAYFNIVLGIIPMPDKLALTLVFAMSPVAIYGVMNITRKLSARYDGEMLKAAGVFLIIAFALLDLMLIVQQTIFAFFDQYRAATSDPAVKESLSLIFKGVNPVQLGIDIAFDIFYCVGAILFSIVLIHLQGFYRILGIYGLLVTVALLVFNMWTFPVPPGESGLIDFGPFCLIFWLVFIVYEIILSRRAKAAAIV